MREETNIEDSLGFALHLSSYIFKANMKERLNAAGFNITPEEFIFIFSMPDGQTAQSVMIKKLLKDKTTMTRLIDRLVKKEWVERSENNQDRREHMIQLTKKGWDIRKKGYPVSYDFSSDVLHGVSQDHIKIARQVMRQIINNLSKDGSRE